MAGRYRTEQERIDAMTVEISVSYKLYILCDALDPILFAYYEVLKLNPCAESKCYGIGLHTTPSTATV